jgi:hypothetical protein
VGGYAAVLGISGPSPYLPRSFRGPFKPGGTSKESPKSDITIAKKKLTRRRTWSPAVRSIVVGEFL